VAEVFKTCGKYFGLYQTSISFLLLSLSLSLSLSLRNLMSHNDVVFCDLARVISQCTALGNVACVIVQFTEFRVQHRACFHFCDMRSTKLDLRFYQASVKSHLTQRHVAFGDLARSIIQCTALGVAERA